MKRVFQNLKGGIVRWFASLGETRYVLIREVDGVKIFARIETKDEQRFSNLIFENAYYIAKPSEPWACLMAGCQRVSFIAKGRTSSTLGFSSSVLMNGAFSTSVDRDLDPILKRIKQRSWWQQNAALNG